MILSNIRIHQALDKGWLVINPQPVPRRRGDDGQECPYQTSAVDLKLGDEISFLKSIPALPINIDLRSGGFANLFGPNSQTVSITQSQPFVLEPRMFVLGKTREHVTLPLRKRGPCLAARIEGRSSFARCGLLIHFTAPTIHAGFSGTITLELCNLGPYKISLYPDVPICQLIVEQVDGVPFPNESQFQGQSRAGGRVHS